MERLAILVSGGDAPGANAAIEAAVRHAGTLGLEVLGVERGFAGLAAGHAHPLRLEDVDGIAARGGAVLGTSRDRTVADEDGRRSMMRVIAAQGIGGVIVLGGDGSIRHGATALAAVGVNCAAIPCSIDNDVPLTDRTLGFDSACNRAVTLADGIRDTGQALHGRMFVLETLGGDTGFLALAVAEATHADAVLLPEYPLDLGHAAERLRHAVERQGYALIVAGEGVADVPGKAAHLAEATGHRVRVTNLGHAQRGGPPTFLDRWLAGRFAAAAVDAVVAGTSGCVTVCHGFGIALAAVADVAAATKSPDRRVYDRLNGLPTASS